MKKMIALALSAVMALSLVACGEKGNAVDDNANIVGDDPATWEPTITIDSEQRFDIEIPAPFSECSSLEEAAQNAGFSFNVPEAVDGYTQRIIRTTAGEFEKGVLLVESLCCQRAALRNTGNAVCDIGVTLHLSFHLPVSGSIRKSST